ncbi:MAG: hypothetical protein ACP5PO_08380 [Desulfurella sp.]|jgi:succinate-acetate transporter protein
MTAFSAYGAFWIALAFLIYMGRIWHWIPDEAFGAALGVTLIALTIFTQL